MGKRTVAGKADIRNSNGAKQLLATGTGQPVSGVFDFVGNEDSRHLISLLTLPHAAKSW